MNENLQKIKNMIGENPTDYQAFLELGDYYLDENPYLTYLCLENALFYCNDEAAKSNIASVLGELINAGIYVRPVSFIILSYNEKNFTQMCLDSIRRTVPTSARDIIVVDNASTDGSVEYLKEQSDIKLILNSENQGFPKGCNQGIEASDPNTDIFLLNNDTIMLPNSLFWLRMGLYSDENYGATGSVTNYASNMQVVKEAREMDILTNEGFDSLYGLGVSVNNLMNNPYEEKIYLVGFAELIKRNVIDEIGLLDERFSPGNYEDVDYGLRIINGGYKNVVCHNSFIIHFGSVSFGKDAQKYHDLLRINRDKMIDKWGMNVDYYKNARMDLINHVTEPHDKALKVLELGCGLGASAAKIKYLYPNSEIYGLDICEEVIDIANAFAHVEQTDVEVYDWPWEDEFFDYVIMGDVLEHLRYPDVVLKKLHRMVKQGGHIILSMPNVMHYSVMIPLITESKFTYRSEGILDTTHLKMYTKYEIERLINEAGYIVEAGAYSMPITPNEEEQKIVDILTGLMKKKDPEQFVAYQYMFKAIKK